MTYDKMIEIIRNSGKTIEYWKPKIEIADIPFEWKQKLIDHFSPVVPPAELSMTHNITNLWQNI